LRTLARGYALTGVIFLSLLLSAAGARPEDARDIRVDGIEPGLKSGYLVASASIHGIFTPRIVGTIQSGLPSVVQIEVQVVSGKKTRARRRLLRRITYDIWAERYRIESEDTVVTTPDFEEVKRITNTLASVRLVARGLLNERDRLKIRVRVQVIPISVRQGKKVLSWLQEADQTEEELASEDRSSGFRFNLSRLVSFFVSGDKKHGNTSPWYTSAEFRISEL